MTKTCQLSVLRNISYCSSTFAVFGPMWILVRENVGIFQHCGNKEINSACNLRINLHLVLKQNYIAPVSLMLIERFMSFTIFYKYIAVFFLATMKEMDLPLWLFWHLTAMMGFHSIFIIPLHLNWPVWACPILHQY